MQLQEDILKAFIDEMKLKGLTAEQLEKLKGYLMSPDFSSEGLKELISTWVVGNE